MNEAIIKRGAYNIISHSKRLYFELIEKDSFDEAKSLRVHVKNSYKILGAIINSDELEALKNPKPEIFDISCLTEDVVSYFRSRLRHVLIKLKLECESGLCTVADPERYISALSNLIVNAYQNVSPEEGEVTVKLKKYGNSCVVSVCDNGCGIPNFKQTLETAINEETGLSIVNAFCNTVGSKLVVETSPDGGAVVSFKLGLETPEDKSCVVHSLNTDDYSPACVYTYKIEGCIIDML